MWIGGFLLYFTSDPETRPFTWNNDLLAICSISMVFSNFPSFCLFGSFSGITRVFVARGQIKNLRLRELSMAPLKKHLRPFIWDFLTFLSDAWGQCSLCYATGFIPVSCIPLNLRKLINLNQKDPWYAYAELGDNNKREFTNAVGKLSVDWRMITWHITEEKEAEQQEMN